jgi:hypothetical protein
MLFILLLLLGGGVWFLYASRAEAQQKAREFAQDVVKSMAVNYDVGFLNNHLTPAAQVSYIPSWRDRMVQHLKGFGPLTKPIETKGDVAFKSVFFDPHGRYETELTYANMTAKLNLAISRGMTAWQVEEIELIWVPPPTPPPQAAPSPTPSPTPTPEQRKKKRG